MQVLQVEPEQAQARFCLSRLAINKHKNINRSETALITNQPQSTHEYTA